LAAPVAAGAPLLTHHQFLGVVTYAATSTNPAPSRRFQSRSRGGPNFGWRRPIRRWRDRSRRRCAGSRNGGSNTPRSGPDDIQDRSTSRPLRNQLRRSLDRRVGCRPERYGLSQSLTYNGTLRAHRIGGSTSRRQTPCLRHGAQPLRRPQERYLCPERPQLVVAATRDMFLAWCWFRLGSAPVPSAGIPLGTNADPTVGARTSLRTERQLTPSARSPGRSSGSWTGTSTGTWWSRRA
jgi:hypothetical protein